MVIVCTSVLLSLYGTMKMGTSIKLYKVWVLKLVTCSLFCSSQSRKWHNWPLMAGGHFIVNEDVQSFGRPNQEDHFDRLYCIYILYRLIRLPLELKVIYLCHHYRARSACTHVQSNQALYCWLANIKFSS